MRKKANSGAERSKESKIIQQERAQKRTPISSIEERRNREQTKRIQETQAEESRSEYRDQRDTVKSKCS